MTLCGERFAAEPDGFEPVGRSRLRRRSAGRGRTAANQVTTAPLALGCDHRIVTDIYFGRVRIAEALKSFVSRVARPTATTAAA